MFTVWVVAMTATYIYTDLLLLFKIWIIYGNKLFLIDRYRCSYLMRRLIVKNRKRINYLISIINCLKLLSFLVLFISIFIFHFTTAAEVEADSDGYYS
jgi:hypothetical protein